MEGWQACQLVVEGTEDDEGDDGSDANSTKLGRVSMHRGAIRGIMERLHGRQPHSAYILFDMYKR